jgi:uncharacterized integral membrane protein
MGLGHHHSYCIKCHEIIQDAALSLYCEEHRSEGRAGCVWFVIVVFLLFCILVLTAIMWVPRICHLVFG